MQIESSKRISHRVVALYEDDAKTFQLPMGATVGELAERLAALRPLSTRQPVHVEVTLGR
ncbi:MAG TPA: hypothetical protein VNT30_20875 [Stellaceae bacterium]|nr:hypothetical protein [Stellaceae bacterium]